MTFTASAEETLQMIEYFTGPSRAENAQRFKTYFCEFDKNRDGVLQFDELSACIHGVCNTAPMTPSTLFWRLQKCGWVLHCKCLYPWPVSDFGLVVIPPWSMPEPTVID